MASATTHPSPVRRAASALRRDLGADLRASIVVFLVALPLSSGVAVASGVPVELGLVTGIIGGSSSVCCPAAACRSAAPPPA